MKPNALHNTDPVVGRLSRFLKTQVLFLDRAQIGGMHRGMEVGWGQQLLRVEGTLTEVSRTEATMIESKLYARRKKNKNKTEQPALEQTISVTFTSI